MLKKGGYIIFFITLFCVFSLFGKDAQKGGVILIVSSYNPDAQRMSAFINDFESEIIKHKNYTVLIENLGCKGVSDANSWKRVFENLLSRYKNKNIKAVILLGQESFATYLSMDSIPLEVPFFTTFASENGLMIPLSDESVNMAEMADKKGVAGGILNRYDVARNIDLILSLYPDTKNIAFVSDNTYGGISLQALVKKEMGRYPDLTLTLIDSRVMEYQEATDKIGRLPENSALLLGTWRVDKNEMYMLNNALTNLNSLHRSLPVFTLTGTGLGSVAIGGYIPEYRVNGKEIASQINDYYASESDTAHFLTGENYYIFDKGKLDEYIIRESHLPKGSVIKDSSEVIIAKYQVYIYWSLAVIVILVVLMTWLYKIYRKNKELQKELIVAKEQAEESDRLKTAFLANMGHEIRTPLNAIMGFTNLLCDDSLAEDSRDEYCQIIRKNSDLLLTLINDILDISRMEAGKMTFDYNKEETDAICQQIMLTTDHLAKEGVEIKHIPGKENVVIETDFKRISQVLINFMTNAIKFTEKGSVVLSYEVNWDKAEVIFYVTDTGCGIPIEQHVAVFNRFEKLNNHIQGTGLGLAICKQISSHLGGDVWIDSSYKGGTRFCFSHPINKK